MTVRKRLFINSLLLVVIPTITMMILVLLYMLVLKTQLFPNGFGGTNTLQSIQSVNDILSDYNREELGNESELCHELVEKLEGSGFQAVILLNDQKLDSSATGKISEYTEIYNMIKQYKIPQAVWIEREGHNIFYEESNTASGKLSILLFKSSRDLSGVLDGNSMTKLILSLIIFLILSVVIVISVTMRLSKRLVKRITNPLEVLTDGAKRIQNGDYDQEIPELKDKEFFQLAGTMNQMQKNLKTSRELNETYEKSRREMLAGISHDLRTPLTSIKSYVQGLRDGVAVTPDKYAHYLDVISRKANDMEGLIQSLFLISKMQSGAYLYQMQPVEMTKFLATTLDSILSDFNENQLELEYRFDPEQRIYANVDLMEFPRAISNILHNSVKYSKGKRISEIVTLEIDGSEVIISLKDNGPGVTSEELPMLFDAFYRADLSRSNPAQGHGLGLAIVKSIIEGHGGIVNAESEDGLRINIRIPGWKGGEE